MSGASGQATPRPTFKFGKNFGRLAQRSSVWLLLTRLRLRLQQSSDPAMFLTKAMMMRSRSFGQETSEQLSAVLMYASLNGSTKDVYYNAYMRLIVNESLAQRT
jgi:hypothetical protein